MDWFSLFSKPNYTSSDSISRIKSKPIITKLSSPRHQCKSEQNFQTKREFKSKSDGKGTLSFQHETFQLDSETCSSGDKATTSTAPFAIVTRTTSEENDNSEAEQFNPFLKSILSCQNIVDNIKLPTHYVHDNMMVIRLQKFADIQKFSESVQVEHLKYLVSDTVSLNVQHANNSDSNKLSLKVHIYPNGAQDETGKSVSTFATVGPKEKIEFIKNCVICVFLNSPAKEVPAFQKCFRVEAADILTGIKKFVALKSDKEGETKISEFLDKDGGILIGFKVTHVQTAKA